MSDSICPACSASINADRLCPKCNGFTAIATPETAAHVKVTPPIASDSAFREGLPPMPVPIPERRMLGPGRVVVGLTIIGMTLICLLVPAIQKVRETAARTQSINNLKQIGFASLAFHDTQKRLPFNGSAVAVGGVSYSLEAKPGQFTSGSWCFQILPFIDQAPLFNEAKAPSAGIAAFMCPGRGRPAYSTSTDWPWTDYFINDYLNDSTGSAPDTFDIKRTLVGLINGTSNTIFAGHGNIQTTLYAQDTDMPNISAGIHIGGTWATARGGPNKIAPNCALARDNSNAVAANGTQWGGPFPQGGLMGMCDGTVRMFSYDMSGTTFGRFLDPFGFDGEHPNIPDT
jgi:Protein of unknown function (DUF1559)